MADEPLTCARVSGTVAGGQPSDAPGSGESTSREEVIRMSVRVGQKAPDFTAPAHYKGGFTSVTLSEYAGKWVMLCFYPGDFTFV